MIFVLNFYPKNIVFGKAGLVGPSTEGQLDPPASLRNQSRYGASALLLAPGHFPPPKPAGALVVLGNLLNICTISVGQWLEF